MRQLGRLARGDNVAGFTVDALYVDEADTAVGASLRHEHTGLRLDLLGCETIPQAHIRVDTEPVSDRGEPHTQEHLLLGKGNRGRATALVEQMALVTSTAYTAQTHTAYAFASPVGLDSFLSVLEARLLGLLKPDYTDEEIRREVHHLGVVTDADGARRLEEKGTIYAEMVSAMQKPMSRLWRQLLVDLYGPGHAESCASGGLPDAIRELRPEHIRSFHARCYRLGRMATILVLPPTADAAAALGRVDAALVRLQPTPTQPEPTPEPAPPRPAEVDVREVGWPERDPGASASILMSYPPVRDLPLRERWLLELLLQGLAGAEDTPLYRALVDSTHRERDLGATSVTAWVDHRPGLPVHFSVGGIPSPRLDDAAIEWLRDRVRRELQRVHQGVGRRDLTGRLRDLWTTRRRHLRSWLASPPRFGARGVYSSWHEHLDDLRAEGGFRRPLALGPVLADVANELEQEGAWAARIERWGLLERPMVHVARPQPDLLTASTTDREQRLAAHVADLVAAEGVPEQEALARLQVRFDTATRELQDATAVPTAAPVPDPPLTPDDALDWRVDRALGVERVTSRFRTMPGAEVGIAFTLDGVSEAHEDLLVALPDLLTEVGVIVDGQRIPHTQVLEALRREVLSIHATLLASCWTGRAELGLTASGTDPQEAVAAVRWLTRFLVAPDWTAANLPRVRDVVDERLELLRRRMQGREEHWARSVGDAWLCQADRIQLRSWCFLARVFDAQRLKWRLQAPSASGDAAIAGVASLSDRAAIEAALVGEHDVLADLRHLLQDIPDASLARDWPRVCDRARADLSSLPTNTLEALETLRSDVVRRAGARLWAAGGPALDAVQSEVEALLEGLSDRPVPDVTRAYRPEVRARLADRGEDYDAVHVGLLDENRQTGIAMFSVPHVTYDRLDDEALLDLLAARAYGGGGPHSLFMRTWAAGLAYSNGTGASPVSGRFSWYAERCPEIARTVQFALDAVSGDPPEADLAEYTLAQQFWSRAGGRYEGRASAIAADLADGMGPDRVRQFRLALLRLRSPDLHARIRDRVHDVHSRLFPGMGTPAPSLVSLAIGDARQLDGWADWLKRTEGVELVRITPRDFWLGL